MRFVAVMVLGLVLAGAAVASGSGSLLTSVATTRWWAAGSSRAPRPCAAEDEGVGGGVRRREGGQTPRPGARRGMAGAAPRPRPPRDETDRQFMTRLAIAASYLVSSFSAMKRTRSTTRFE
jgi:hypothetical protein